LGQEFAQQDIYFPSLYALTSSRRENRDKRIVEEYESGIFTIGELGKKYKMTVVGICSVLNRAKAYNAPSGVADPRDDIFIERIKKLIGEMDEKGRREFLRYVIKKRNSRQANREEMQPISAGLKQFDELS
jgi:hypothetical protein